MNNLSQRLKRFLNWTWRARPATAGLRLIQRLTRVVIHVGRQAARGDLQLNAMSLSYTTLLSLVPLLAVTFSVLKAFGSNDVIEPFLLSLLSPLGSSAQPLAAQIIEFVSKVKVGVLGAVGIGLLFYTVIALMQKIERVFNSIWQVHQLRQFSARFASYLSVLMVGPVLVLAATGLTATLLTTPLVKGLTDITPFGMVFAVGTWLAPLVMWIGAFTFLYAFIPNTRVQFGAALVGGAVAGVLWNATSLVFGGLIAGSTSYTAIYSAFASLILFMVWLQIAWMIVLVGASVSYAWQNSRRLHADFDHRKNTPAMLMLAAVEVLACISECFEHNTPPPTSDDIKNQLAEAGIDFDQTDLALKKLHDHQLIRATDEREPGWLPAMPRQQLDLEQLTQAIYGPLPRIGTGHSTLGHEWLEAEKRYRLDTLAALHPQSGSTRSTAATDPQESP